MSANGPIILIEDDEDDQYLLQRAINQLAVPNPIRFFPNGQAALNYLQVTEEKAFLILCDINMPVMSGLELHEHINNNEHLKKKAIPFIFLTTGASPELVDQAYKGTIQGFFQKASRFDELQKQFELIVNYWRVCLHPNSFEK